jgi:hypothetical protein
MKEFLLHHNHLNSIKNWNPQLSWFSHTRKKVQKNDSNNATTQSMWCAVLIYQLDVLNLLTWMFFEEGKRDEFNSNMKLENVIHSIWRALKLFKISTNKIYFRLIFNFNWFNTMFWDVLCWLLFFFNSITFSKLWFDRSSRFFLMILLLFFLALTFQLLSPIQGDYSFFFCFGIMTCFFSLSTIERRPVWTSPKLS